MAAINTTFGFRDQITQNLSLLNNALTQLNNTLSAMKGQMSTANSAIEKVSESSQKAADGVGGISAKMLNFNAAVGIFHSVKGAVDSVTASIGEMSAAYNFQMTQENKLATVMRSRMKASEEQIQSVKNYASTLQSGGVIGDEVQLAGAQELATYISDVETLKTLMPVLNDIAVQASPDMNVSGQQMMNIATMLGKVMGGSLSGMSRRGWVFTEEEKKQFEAMNEQQRAKFLAAYAQDAIGKQNENAAQTAAGQIIQLNNAMGDLKEQVGQAMIPYSQFFTISTMEWKISFYETLVNALNFTSKHIAQTKIALIGLGVAIGAIAAAFVVLKWSAISAWLAVAGPIIGIIAAIVGIVAVLTSLFVFASKTFPAIGGFIGGVAGVAKEVGAQLKYYFGTAIEGIVNGFLMMKNTVVNAFLSMFDFLLSGVERVASAMDSVFGTSMAANISGFRNALAEMKNQEQSKFTLGWEDNRQGFGNSWNSGWDSGAKMGAEIAEKMNKSLEGMFGKFKSTTGGNSNLDKLSFGSDGSLKTSDSSLVDIADDYKELLSARARERFNLKFSQMTPEVNIGDVVVTGEADEDRLIKKLADALLEATTAYTRESA